MRSELTVLLGASGFLGSRLKLLLEASGAASIAPSRNEILILGQGDPVVGVKNLIAEYSPKKLINCIAEIEWKTCRDFPSESEVPNVKIPEAIATSLSERAHFIHVSTDAVFGGASAPYSLNDKTCPVSTYGSQKAEAERLLLSICPDNVSVLRGAFFGLPGKGRNNVLKFFLEAFLKGKPVEGYTDFVNSPVSVDTFARAVMRVLNHGPIGVGHFGSERGYSKWEFASLVAKSLELPESLVIKSVSPISSVAHGGLDLTLESRESWSKLGTRAPEMLSEISEMQHEFEGWTDFGN